MTTKLLRLSQLPLTAIADFPFRSPAEVARVLEAIQIPDVSTASMKHLPSVEVAIKLSDTDHDGPTVELPENHHSKDPGHTGFQGFLKKKFKLAGIKGEPVKLGQKDGRTVKKLTQQHQELQGHKERINALKVNAAQTFKDSKHDAAMNKLMSVFDKREQEIIEQELHAHEQMHDIAEAHLPESAYTMFNKVLNPVVKGLKGKFKGSSSRYTISTIPGERAMIQFQKIVELTGLKKDDGFSYQHFYLIATCIIDENTHYHYFVDTSVATPTPNTSSISSHNRGTPFTKWQDGLRLLQTHLSVDEHLDMSIPTELPRAKHEIEGAEFRNGYIKSVKVNEAEHTIQFTTEAVGPKVIQNVLKDVLADLAGLFQSNSVHEKLKHRVAKLSSGGYKIVVWVGTPAPRIGSDYKADSHRLDVLRHDLNLDENETNQIRRVLRGRAPNKADHSEGDNE